MNLDAPPERQLQQLRARMAGLTGHNRRNAWRDEAAEEYKRFEEGLYKEPAEFTQGGMSYRHWVDFDKVAGAREVEARGANVGLLGRKRTLRRAESFAHPGQSEKNHVRRQIWDAERSRPSSPDPVTGVRS